MTDTSTEQNLPEIMLRFHYDKNGSWLQVPLTMLALLNMPPEVFSTYSYIDKESMYLEQDIDALKFLNRFKYLYTQDPVMEVIDHGENAKTIREMDKNTEGTEVILH